MSTATTPPGIQPVPMPVPVLYPLDNIVQVEYKIFVNSYNITAVSIAGLMNVYDPPKMVKVIDYRGKELSAYSVDIRLTNGEEHRLVTTQLQHINELLSSMLGAASGMIAHVEPPPAPPSTLSNDVLEPVPGYLSLGRPLTQNDQRWLLLQAKAIASIKHTTHPVKIFVPTMGKTIVAYNVVISTVNNREYSTYFISLDELDWFMKLAQFTLAMAIGGNSRGEPIEQPVGE